MLKQISLKCRVFYLYLYNLGILESQSTRLKSNEIEKNEIDAKLRNKSHELED